MRKVAYKVYFMGAPEVKNPNKWGLWIRRKGSIFAVENRFHTTKPDLKSKKIYETIDFIHRMCFFCQCAG